MFVDNKINLRNHKEMTNVHMKMKDNLLPTL
jgi:hypothetical protein